LYLVTLYEKYKFFRLFLPYLEKWSNCKFPDYFGFGALPGVIKPTLALLFFLIVLFEDIVSCSDFIAW